MNLRSIANNSGWSSEITCWFATTMRILLDRIVLCKVKCTIVASEVDSGWTLMKHKYFPKTKLIPQQIALGVVHYKFLPPGTTTTAVPYSAGTGEIRWQLCKKELSLVNRKGPLLTADNPNSHMGKITKQAE